MTDSQPGPRAGLESVPITTPAGPDRRPSRREMIFMSTTQTALFVGLVLGIVATFGGFGSFLVVLVFGAIGLVVGRVMEGKLDLRSLTGQSSAKL